jgi:chromosome partitioning protein
MTTTIAIGNQKGGVAKTTTTLSLGAAFAEMGHSVLLVDLDPQANLTLSLGLQPHNLRHSAIDALLGTDSLVGVSRESAVFRMDIVPSNRELIILDKVLANKNGEQLRLRRKLDDSIHRLYDFVLVDCPPSAGNLTMNALAAANLLIVPVQCEFYAAHSLRQTTQLVRRAQIKNNPALKYRVLVTIYDQRNKISRLILEQLQGALSAMLFQTIIQIDTKLRESPAYGKPIARYAPSSRGARQYRDLAEEILESLIPEPVGS